MIEIKNSCCLHHVSGGNYSEGDPNCPGCNGTFDEMDKKATSTRGSGFNRDNAVRAGSWVGSITAGAAASVTGMGTVSG